MENQHTDDLSRILRTVEEILEIVHFMKDHRSQLEGDPILDFAEVCQLLCQSERQVRRFREQGLLVGFNIGARRMYLLSEVQEFIRKMRRRGKSGRSWRCPFTTKQELATWCRENQPYYKKHIPGVVAYFARRYRLR